MQQALRHAACDLMVGSGLYLPITEQLSMSDAAVVSLLIRKQLEELHSGEYNPKLRLIGSGAVQRELYRINQRVAVRLQVYREQGNSTGIYDLLESILRFEID